MCFVWYFFCYMCALKHMTSPPAQKFTNVFVVQLYETNGLQKLKTASTPSDERWMQFLMTKNNIYPKRSVFSCLTVKWESSFILFETTLRLQTEESCAYLARARGSSSATKRILPWIKWKYIRNTKKRIDTTNMEPPVFIGKCVTSNMLNGMI